MSTHHPNPFDEPKVQQAKNRLDRQIDRLGKVVEEATGLKGLDAMARVFSSASAEIAERSVCKRFRDFAAQLSPGTDLDTYFHPINRSAWQTDFAHWLIEQNREASNE